MPGHRTPKHSPKHHNVARTRCNGLSEYLLGVHTSDATNAWRNMARMAESRHAVYGLIVAA